MSASDNLGPQFVDAFHHAPRLARKSIEEKGILPSSDSFDQEQVEMTGHTAGAFFVQNKTYLEHYLGDSHSGDIWHGKVPADNVYQDPQLEDADYTTEPISSVTRVGHATDVGVHWHPEENCPHCN